MGASPFPNVDLADLVQRFAPITRLHPEEPSLPSGADWYLEKVQYVHLVNGQVSDVLPPGWWQPGTFPYTTGTEADYFQIPGDDGVNPDPPPAVAYVRRGDITTATAYVHAVPVYFDQNGNPGTWLDLQYWLFYPFNGAESFVVDNQGGIYTEYVPWSFHEGDFECVTVRVSTSQQVVGAGFSQHSGVQWLWTPGQGFQVQGTQVISYVAIGSHANYPAPGGPYWIGSETVSGVQAAWRTGWCGNPGQGSQSVDYSQDTRTVIVADDTGWFGTPPAPPSWLPFDGHWGMPAAVPLTTEELEQAITAAIDAIVPGWLATILIAAGVPGELADVIIVFRDSIDQEGPANLPQQGGWRAAPEILAAAFDGSNWTPFPVPEILASTSPSCLTEQVNGLLDIHAAYRDNDGYPCYVHFSADTGTWLPPARVGTMQCDTAPAIAAFNGTLYCVFANNALLYFSAQNAAGGWPPAVSMKNAGIAYHTSPALFVQGSVLYCVYQYYGSGGGGGDGELLCITLQPNSSTWAQDNPASSDYWGMTSSPAAAPGSHSGTYVLYQGYNNAGYLSATTLGPVGWHKSVEEVTPPAGWPSKYMSAAPAAAFWQNTLYAAFQRQQNSPAFAVAVVNGAQLSSVTAPLDAVSPPSTPPSLLAYGASLLCFWVAPPE